VDTTRSTRHDVALALPVTLLVLAWASTFAAIKVGLDDCPPVLFSGLRALVGAAAMAPVAWRSGAPVRLGATWRTYAVLAALNVVLFFGFQSLALRYLPSGTAAVLIYLQPVLVGLLAWPMLGERLTVAKLAGLLLGFAGVVAVSAGSLQPDLPVQGVVTALLSALAWAFGTVFVKRHEDAVTSSWAITVQFLVGGLVLTGAGLVVEDPAAISWTPMLWAGLGYAGLVGTALAWALWFRLIRAGEASRAAAYIFFVPVTALAIGAALFGETLTAPMVAGAVLVVAGIHLVNRTRQT
jgi:O-acetylserine/cysteine efflux transporter